MQSCFSKTIAIIAGFALLPGCTALDRIATLGDQPALTAIENPTSQPGYKPVHMPMPTPMPASYSPNSLWRNGSRAFFKDQRAHQVGDILHEVANIGIGDAIIFRISSCLEHRVSPIEGAVPRTSYAGFFQSEPVFLSLLKSQLPESPRETTSPA
jgi:hypothetical protein